MTPTQSQVVVGFDFSDSSHRALERAITLATRAPFHVLHIVCVIEPHTPLPAVPAHEVDYVYAERVQYAITDVVASYLNAADVAGQSLDMRRAVISRRGGDHAFVLGAASVRTTSTSERGAPL